MMELDLSWSGPYSWPEFEENNGLPKLPTLPGVYLWTVEYLGGYLIYAAGITGRSFRKRLREHTPKFLAGEYTVLDISDMQGGRRSELWHGWGWTSAKRVQFAERQNRNTRSSETATNWLSCIRGSGGYRACPRTARSSDYEPPLRGPAFLLRLTRPRHEPLTEVAKRR